MCQPFSCKYFSTKRWICICLTISSCYSSIPLTLGLIGTDGGLSILCHSCRFACQRRVLKTFPSHGYFCYEDGVVWLCHLLVNLEINITKQNIFYLTFEKYVCVALKSEKMANVAWANTDTLYTLVCAFGATARNKT